MTEETGNDDTETGGGDESYLGAWKTKDAAEEGLKHLESKLGSQGNELGLLKQQVEMTQQALSDIKSQPPALPTIAPDAPDYDKEMNTIQGKIAELDSMDEDYQGSLAELIQKSNMLSAKVAHEKTLSAATETFKKELDERDVKATHKAFYDQNPDFNTPEMQMQIKDYMTKDTTGMSDPLVAFREIQRDAATARTKELEEENADLKRMSDLEKGTNITGKVITKGQSIQQKTKQQKATGAELDKGMQATLDALRE